MSATLLPVEISITRESDGETVLYQDSLYQHDDYDGTFIWEDGNYSCNCNRSLFFYRALGLSEEEVNAREAPCSGGETFRVNFIRDASGKVWYSERGPRSSHNREFGGRT